MERLRYVARSGGADPACSCRDRRRLTQPGPGAELSWWPLCRNLVERNPTCGPLWWLCARLLAKPGAVGAARGGSPTRSPTTARPTGWLAERARGSHRGDRRLARARRRRRLRRRGDVRVLAVDAGRPGFVGSSGGWTRQASSAELVPPEAMLSPAAVADIVLVEAEACSTAAGRGADRRRSSPPSAAAAVGVPVWLVAGRGRRLPAPYRRERSPSASPTQRSSCSPRRWSCAWSLVARRRGCRVARRRRAPSARWSPSSSHRRLIWAETSS